VRRNGSLIVALSAVVLGLTLSGTALGAPPPGELSLAGEGEITVEGSDSDTASTQLIVVNPGYAVPVKVEFLSSSESDLAIGFAPKLIRAHGATAVTVNFSGLSGLSKAVKGALVIKGGASPIARPIKVSRGLHPSKDWPVIIVIGAVVATLLLVAGIVYFAWGFDGTHLSKKAPGPKWSFSSWATTLTAVGAVFSTVGTAATYPPEPVQITKDSLVALSLMFGALVVIGPFVFQAMRNPKASASDQESGLWGYSWALLASCAITFGAVLGELGCFALLAWELIPELGWALSALVAILLIALLAGYYFAVTAWSLAKTDWEKQVAEEREKKPMPVVIVGGDGGEHSHRTITGGETNPIPQPAELNFPVVPERASWNLP
jgi:hypothetical protein